MSATGIGAAVRRKEDFRFITGKGQYTDDISRPGQTSIYFIRSPHAHAKIKKIDTRAASGMPGVVGVFTGADFAESTLGGLICGWVVLSLKTSDPAEGAQQMMENLASKIGAVLVVLGIMHFFNLYVFNRMRRRAMDERKPPPVAPGEFIRPAVKAA